MEEQEKIPLPPADHARIGFAPAAGVIWDPDLSAVRIEGDTVMGVMAGYTTPEGLAPGDVYFRLLSATFIDEPASQGRHSISVDVLDEAGQRLQGARVWHGWPTGSLPAFDERVEATIFGAEMARWDLYSGYDAWLYPGPYWVQCADGPSELFYGAGLPWNRHVCFAVVFQRAAWQQEQPPVDPPVDPPADDILTVLQSIDATLAALALHLGA